jgi:hypothetical protein
MGTKLSHFNLTKEPPMLAAKGAGSSMANHDELWARILLVQ